MRLQRKEKKSPLKLSRQKDQITCKGKGIRMASTIHKARQQWNSFLKKNKGVNQGFYAQPTILVSNVKTIENISKYTRP